MTADQLAVLRSHIGSADPPSDVTLNASFDRLGSVEAVALEVLRGRLADMTSGPGQLSVAGHVSYDSRKSIDALAGKIADLETGETTDDNVIPGVLGVVHLVRQDRSR
jgi:hypothetical protein